MALQLLDPGKAPEAEGAGGPGAAERRPAHNPKRALCPQERTRAPARHPSWWDHPRQHAAGCRSPSYSGPQARTTVATGQPLPVPLPFPAWRRPLPISPSRGLSDHLGDMRVSIWSGHVLCMPRDSQPEVEPAAAAVLRPMGARGGGRGPRQGPGERAPRGHAGAARCPAVEQTPAYSPGSEKEGRGSLPDSSPRREPAPPSPGGAAWPGGTARLDARTLERGCRGWRGAAYAGQWLWPTPHTQGAQARKQ